MSSELTIRMDLLKAHMETLFPDRVITRDLIDFAARDQADLKKGVYTLIARNENDFTNLLGRVAMYGAKGLYILGQLLVNDESQPHTVEDAEGLMIDEIKELCRNLPDGIGDMTLMQLQQSAQIDYPYGWVLFELQTRED
jgi:hypothetical protein